MGHGVDAHTSSQAALSQKGIILWGALDSPWRGKTIIIKRVIRRIKKHIPIIQKNVIKRSPFTV